MTYEDYLWNNARGEPGGPTCVRCGERPGISDGCCGPCVWATRAEIRDGFDQIRDYLRSWAAYQEWCVQHHVAA